MRRDQPRYEEHHQGDQERVPKQQLQLPEVVDLQPGQVVGPEQGQVSDESCTSPTATMKKESAMKNMSTASLAGSRGRSTTAPVNRSHGRHAR